VESPWPAWDGALRVCSGAWFAQDLRAYWVATQEDETNAWVRPAVLYLLEVWGDPPCRSLTAKVYCNGSVAPFPQPCSDTRPYLCSLCDIVQQQHDIGAAAPFQVAQPHARADIHVAWPAAAGCSRSEVLGQQRRELGRHAAAGEGGGGVGRVSEGCWKGGGQVRWRPPLDTSIHKNLMHHCLICDKSTLAKALVQLSASCALGAAVGQPTSCAKAWACGGGRTWVTPNMCEEVHLFQRLIFHIPIHLLTCFSNSVGGNAEACFTTKSCMPRVEAAQSVI
jgi:hypothetical protein